MKLIVISFLLSIFSSLLNSAELKFEAYGYSSSEIINISDQHIFYHYSDRFIFTTNKGISGDGNCRGIVEVVKGKQSSNLVCKAREKNVKQLQIMILLHKARRHLLICQGKDDGRNWLGRNVLVLHLL